MSPEQLKILQRLSLLFEEGTAGPGQIKELSALLAEINKNHDPRGVFSHSFSAHSRANSNNI